MTTFLNAKAVSLVQIPAIHIRTINRARRPRIGGGWFYAALLLLATVAFGEVDYTQGTWNGGKLYGGQLGATTTIIPPPPSLSFAQLPLNWVDDNAAYDGVNCGGLCVGLGYLPPAYELQLGAGGATWIGAAPACTGVFAALTTYTSTAAGKQAAINDIEACRTYGISHGNVQYCTQLDVPPASTQAAYSGNGAVRAGAYWTTSGATVPQTSNVQGSCFNDVRSTQHAALLAMPEPVCAGGVQDNLPTSTAIGLINPDCTGNNLAYQLGNVLTPVTVAGAAAPGITFPYSLANGTTFNTLADLKAAYNYIQYMYEDVCTSFSNCIPLTLCSVTGTSLPCGGTAFGPDHWLFEDGAASMSAGNPSSNTIIIVGAGATLLSSFSQVANDVHFRRYWAHADWTALNTGTNSITNGIQMLCHHCSFVGSQVSQALRPGGEGHSALGPGTNMKFSSDWFEGSSSCIFSGGLSANPFIGYVPFQDVEIGRVRCTYPYQWLGAGSGGVSCAGTLVPCGIVPNDNPYWGAAAAPWIVSPTMVTVDADGVTAHWSSGDPFHDSTSGWPSNDVKIGGVAATIKLLGAGTCSWPAGTGCPTTLTLKASIGPQPSPVTFTMTPNNTVRKNGNEMKEGERIVIYGSFFENVDQSGGQNGTVNTINVRNHSGGGHGQNYYAIITDLTMDRNIFRSACWGPELAARSASVGGDGGGTSGAMRRVSILNSLIYGITGLNPGCPRTHGGFSISSAGQTWKGTVTENAAGTQATFVANYSVDALASVSQSVITATCIGTGCSPSIAANTLQVTAANNFVPGEEVTIGNAPNPTAESFLNGQQVTVLAGVTGTQFTAAFTHAPYSNPSDTGTVSGPTGFEVMNISAGDPVSVTGCASVPSFNVPTHTIGTSVVPVGVGPLAVVGTTPWTGVLTAGNMTVTYPWTATPGTSVDNSGTCAISNIEGHPQNLSIQHMTLITDAPSAFGAGNQPKGGGPNFQLNHLFQDSILLSGTGAGCVQGSSCGWYNSALGEGTPTETFNYDSTTMTADHLVWPTRTASKYTAFGNNPILCNVATPPPSCAAPVLYFPTTAYCTGAVPTSGCVGFAGAMSTSSMPLTLPDYHGFALRSDSAFHAGNASQASDGTDVGANIPAIDAAQTQSPYVCTSACGTPGPFPD